MLSFNNQGPGLFTQARLLRNSRLSCVWGSADGLVLQPKGFMPALASGRCEANDAANFGTHEAGRARDADRRVSSGMHRTLRCITERLFSVVLTGQRPGHVAPARAALVAKQ